MRKTKENTSTDQHAKKVVSDGLGLVDFAVGLVISVLNLPDGQELFFCEIQITEGLQSILPIKKGFGASWNDLWASTYASYSLPALTDIIGTSLLHKNKINLQLTLKSVLLTYSNTNAGVLDCNKNNDNYVIALLN